MYKCLFANFVYENPSLRVWVMGNNLEDSDTISNVLYDVYRFFPSAPLIVMPIEEKPTNGEIIKDVFLLKPSHITYRSPDIFAMNSEFINIFGGFELFFTDPGHCSGKIMNQEMLQCLFDEKGLHMIGVYMNGIEQEEQPINEPKEEEQHVLLKDNDEEEAYDLEEPNDVNIPDLVCQYYGNSK